MNGRHSLCLAGVHEMLSSILWDAATDADALVAAERLAIEVMGASFTAPSSGRDSILVFVFTDCLNFDY